MYIKGVKLIYYWFKIKNRFLFFCIYMFWKCLVCVVNKFVDFYWGICIFVFLGSLDGIFS